MYTLVGGRQTQPQAVSMEVSVNVLPLLTWAIKEMIPFHEFSRRTKSLTLALCARLPL